MLQSATTSKMEKILVLDNIRSAHNVGSLFRTADGAGVSKIFLVGYTPTPIDRFGRVQPEIEKTSLGASHTVAWESNTDAEIVTSLQELKQQGFEIVALEQTTQAEDISTFSAPSRVVYILGNEIDGVCESLLSLATKHVFIPMHGVKESLNVSVAGGVILFWN
jgi:23S rRNA (guanosine2251-2'-O)-methyltransferase